MQSPSHVALVPRKGRPLLTRQSVFWRRVRWICVAVPMICLIIAAYFIYDRYSSQSQAHDRNLEIRLDFIPFQPRREFRDSLSMTLRGDGKVRVVHHRREMFIDAVYEGTLPEAETMRLVGRAKQARSDWATPKLQTSKDDALFRMVVLPTGSSDEKSVFGGQLADASERTRTLIEDLLALWKRLEKAPAAEAYVRCIPLLEEELKRIQANEQRRGLTLAEIPVALQQVVTRSVNQPRHFLPITRIQHDQLLDLRQFIITNNGFSYRLSLSLPPPLPTK